MANGDSGFGAPFPDPFSRRVQEFDSEEEGERKQEAGDFAISSPVNPTGFLRADGSVDWQAYLRRVNSAENAQIAELTSEGFRFPDSVAPFVDRVTGTRLPIDASSRALTPFQRPQAPNFEIPGFLNFANPQVASPTLPDSGFQRNLAFANTLLPFLELAQNSFQFNNEFDETVRRNNRDFLESQRVNNLNAFGRQFAPSPRTVPRIIGI